MIALLACFAALSGPSDFDRAIKWADRLRCDISDLPTGQWAAYGFDAPLQAYDQVVRKYGPHWQATLGIARCYEAQGRVGLGLKLLNNVPPERLDPGELSLAIEKARIADLIEPELRSKLAVMDVLPYPGERRGRWLVVCGRTEVETLTYGNLTRHSGIELRGITFSGGRIRRFVRRVLDIDLAQGVMVRGVMLDGAGAPAIIVDAQLEGGDSSPCGLDIFAARGDQLKCIASFGGSRPFDVMRSPRDHRIVVACRPTFKVWWPDMYEWRDGRFRVANRDYSEFYDEERADLPRMIREYSGYAPYLHAAALSMIDGKRNAALKHLAMAESICLGCLRSTPNRPGGPVYFDAGFYGGTAANLREIRQRIAWIRRGDLNHLLLYRPYDWDLEVPPEKIGDAWKGLAR